jgi:pimeloyl-ACP methyl ester carboxylesterase
MEHVVSRDGIQIAFERSGTGHPLVLVHGTGTDHTYWAPVLPELERHFTVYAVDRRGRGQSGDVSPYAIEREFADVAALVDSIAGQVCLFGHSYGALCSAEAALLATNIRTVVLYEPPIGTTVEVVYPPGALETFTALVDAGRAEDALLMMYEAGDTSPEELSLLRAQRDWSARIEAAHTIPREIMSVRDYAFEPDRFRSLTVPTLFLLGGESSPYYKAAAETLCAALGQGRIAVLPGQGHEGVITVPGLVLREVLRFCPDQTDAR